MWRRISAKISKEREVNETRRALAACSLRASRRRLVAGMQWSSSDEDVLDKVSPGQDNAGETPSFFVTPINWKQGFR